MENMSELEWCMYMLVSFVAGALSMVYITAVLLLPDDASHESIEEDYG